ncbi:MAG: uracil-DNA glycosylase [Candidatus Taylorbacteria bacterium]|nr:uracil-DNA glycosylase [Candidatus Taylorbacteria bacterium]
MKEIRLESSWKNILMDQFDLPYFKELSLFVRNEYQTKETFPNPKNIFKAFDMCPYDSVKVVILGQDPYHGKGQAIGLSFAVPENTTLPPSLKNIFKEIQSDLGITPIQHGNLERWAAQGVLLLNATLTVNAGSPGSHQGKGWEMFTDAVIQKISEGKQHIVFILWGNYARQKGIHIDRKKHLVLEAAHPSPFSAHSGFFGCKHFSKTNAYLKEHGITKIDWK